MKLYTKYFSVCSDKNRGWTRVLGRGFAWKNTKKYPLIFSERHGITKTLKIGSWSFKWLKPVKL